MGILEEELVEEMIVWGVGVAVDLDSLGEEEEGLKEEQMGMLENRLVVLKGPPWIGTDMEIGEEKRAIVELWEREREFKDIDGQSVVNH